jgi:hypothetical protein
MDASSRDAVPPPDAERSPILPEPASATPAAASVGTAWQVAGSKGPSHWRAARTETRRRTFWLGCLAIVLAPVLLVIVVLEFVGSEVGAIASFPGDTGGQITVANIRTVDGHTRWELLAAPGLGPADGARLACDVVPSVFIRHGIRNAEFYVLDQAGDVIGSWQTRCEGPGIPVPAA